MHSPKLDLIYPDRPICWQLLCAASKDVHTIPILANPPHQQEVLEPAGKRHTEELSICYRPLSIPDPWDEGTQANKVDPELPGSKTQTDYSH